MKEKRITSPELVEKIEQFILTLPASLPEISISPRQPMLEHSSEVTIRFYVDMITEWKGK